MTDDVAPQRRNEPALRVLVANGCRGFAEALAERLAAERDIEVVAICADARKVEVVLSLESVDVLLVDWQFDQPDARDEIREVRERWPSVRVAVISGTDGAAYALSAVRAGVLGWVQTSERVDRLCDTIRGVSRGEMWFPPSFVTAALTELIHDHDEGDESRTLIDSLTARELEVVGCLVAGMARSDIARELYISPDTVRTHVHNVLHRLGVHDSVAAAAIARRAGVAPRPPSTDLPNST